MPGAHGPEPGTQNVGMMKRFLKRGSRTLPVGERSASQEVATVGGRDRRDFAPSSHAPPRPGTHGPTHSSDPPGDVPRRGPGSSLRPRPALTSGHCSPSLLRGSHPHFTDVKTAARRGAGGQVARAWPLSLRGGGAASSPAGPPPVPGKRGRRSPTQLGSPSRLPRPRGRSQSPASPARCALGPRRTLCPPSLGGGGASARCSPTFIMHYLLKGPRPENSHPLALPSQDPWAGLACSHQARGGGEGGCEGRPGRGRGPRETPPRVPGRGAESPARYLHLRAICHPVICLPGGERAGGGEGRGGGGRAQGDFYQSGRTGV